MIKGKLSDPDLGESPSEGSVTTDWSTVFEGMVDTVVPSAVSCGFSQRAVFDGSSTSLTVLSVVLVLAALLRLLLLLLATVGTGGGAFGSTRLHKTPCLAQFEHGLSSSHCAKWSAMEPSKNPVARSRASPEITVLKDMVRSFVP